MSPRKNQQSPRKRPNNGRLNARQSRNERGDRDNGRKRRCNTLAAEADVIPPANSVFNISRAGSRADPLGRATSLDKSFASDNPGVANPNDNSFLNFENYDNEDINMSKGEDHDEEHRNVLEHIIENDFAKREEHVAVAQAHMVNQMSDDLKSDDLIDDENLVNDPGGGMNYYYQEDGQMALK